MNLGVVFGCRARDSGCVGAWLGLGYICLDFNDFRGNLHLAGHIPDNGDKMTDPAVQQVSYTNYPCLFARSRPLVIISYY